MLANGGWDLTLILLTWTKWWASASASKWRMGFNSAFKGLNKIAWNLTLNKKNCFAFITGIYLAIHYLISLIYGNGHEIRGSHCSNTQMSRSTTVFFLQAIIMRIKSSSNINERPKILSY
jgi:hypothetical protein